MRLKTLAMKFDLMGIVFMAIAITIANFVGPMLSGVVGMSGGLLGTFILGAIVYAVYCLLTGTKMSLFGGAIFAVLVYVSGIVSAMITSATGFGGGLIGLFVEAMILSLAWGYFGKGKSPISTKTSKQRSKKRR